VLHRELAEDQIETLKQGMAKLRSDVGAQGNKTSQQQAENDELRDNVAQDQETSILKEAMSKLEREHNAAQRDLNMLKTELEVLNQAKIAAEAEAGHLKDILIQRDNTIEELQDELELRKIRYETEIVAKVNEERQSFVKSATELSDTVYQLEQERDQMTQGLQNYQHELEKLEQSRDDAQSQSKKLVEELRRKDKALARLRKELEEKHQTSSEEGDSETSLGKLRRERDESRERYLSAQDQLEEVRAELHASETRAKQLGQKLKITETALRGLKQQVEALPNEELLKERSGAKGSANSVIVQLKNLRQEKLMAETKASHLETQLDESEATVDVLRRELAEVRSNVGDDQMQPSLDRKVYTEAELQILRDIEKERTKQEEARLSTNGADTASLRRLEEENQSLRQKLVTYTSMSGSQQVSIDTLREERGRREDAEELVAVIAHRSKKKLESKIAKIRNLSARLTQVSEEKEAEILALRARIADMERGQVVRDTESETWSYDDRQKLL